LATAGVNEDAIRATNNEVAVKIFTDRFMSFSF
jgi:hypothetical protein